MYWMLFMGLDFPVSLGIYAIGSLVPNNLGGSSPLDDLGNFWLPAIYFGLIGTFWWYVLGVYVVKYYKWIRPGK